MKKQNCDKDHFFAFGRSIYLEYNLFYSMDVGKRGPFREVRPLKFILIPIKSTDQTWEHNQQ